MNIEATIKMRNELAERVLKALATKDKREAVAIVLAWMSAEDVRIMLKTLENQDA